MHDLLYLAKILIEKYEHSIKYEKWYDAGILQLILKQKFLHFQVDFSMILNTTKKIIVLLKFLKTL